MTTTIFVTIGVPFATTPLAQKVTLFVEDTETPVQVAKVLRKNFADHIQNHGWIPGITFTPAELYYDIYLAIDDEMPAISSDNSPTVHNLNHAAVPPKPELKDIHERFQYSTVRI